jgi:hypothetical protein
MKLNQDSSQTRIHQNKTSVLRKKLVSILMVAFQESFALPLPGQEVGLSALILAQLKKLLYFELVSKELES